MPLLDWVLGRRKGFGTSFIAWYCCYPFKYRLPMFEHSDVWTFRCLNVQTSAHSNIGTIASYANVWTCHSNIRVQTSEFKHRRRWSPMVAEVGVFQVAEVPKYWYDYLIPVGLLMVCPLFIWWSKNWKINEKINLFLFFPGMPGRQMLFVFQGIK